MPIFYQHQINETTRLGIWKIEETEEFFSGNVPIRPEVTHPRKRLQHLAGRFLLQFLFPGFPYHLIEIADTNKPFLPDEQYHFSISHCGDFAAAIVSSTQRVGIDIELVSPKAEKIRNKFLGPGEQLVFLETPGDEKDAPDPNDQILTLLWSAKEAVYKWFGDGEVDFRKHIQLQSKNPGSETISCYFSKTGQSLEIFCRHFDHLVLAWVIS